MSLASFTPLVHDDAQATLIGESMRDRFEIPTAHGSPGEQVVNSRYRLPLVIDQEVSLVDEGSVENLPGCMLFKRKTTLLERKVQDVI